MLQTASIDRIIRRTWPRPLAIAWAQSQGAQNPSERLDHLIAFVEQLFRLLTVYSLANLRRVTRITGVPPSGAQSEKLEQLIRRLARPADGTWLHLLSELCEATRDDHFVAELPAWLREVLPDGRTRDRHWHDLVGLRNRARHDGVGTPKIAAQRTGQFEARLRELLESMGWMGAYRLGRVREGRASSEHQRFNGSLEVFVGSDAVPEHLTAAWRGWLAEGEVFLLHASGVELLPLSPLVEYSATADAAEERLFVFKYLGKSGDPYLKHDRTQSGFFEAFGSSSGELSLQGWLRLPERNQTTRFESPVRVSATVPPVYAAPSAAHEPRRRSAPEPTPENPAGTPRSRQRLLWAALIVLAAIPLTWALLTHMGTVDADASNSTAAPHFGALPPIPPDMVAQIPGGELVLGVTDDEVATHLDACRASQTNRCDAEDYLLMERNPGPDPMRKRIEPFRLDRLEVSRQMYDECVRAGICEAIRDDLCEIWVYHPEPSRRWRDGRQLPPRSRQPSSPRTCIGRQQAQTYCEARAGRLPSDAEWEWAARGPERRVFPWGNEWSREAVNVLPLRADDPADDYRNPNNPPTLDDVGVNSRGATPRTGIHQMGGNAYEWVSDNCYAYSTAGHEEVCRSNRGNGLTRGGSFLSHGGATRTTYRRQSRVEIGYDNVGFRCAYDLD